MQRGQSPNPPLDVSLHSDGGHDRMNAGGLINVSLRECALPPEDLPRRAAPDGGDENTRKLSSHKEHRRHHKKKKKSKKKKSDKERKDRKRPDEHGEYQELPNGSKSSKEKRSKAHRAIPESLTGREVSWGRFYLEYSEDIPFREDLGSVPKASHRRRRKSSEGETPPIREADEEQQREPRIILDPDGFPIQKHGSTRSGVKSRGSSKPTSLSAHNLDDSFTSTEKSHTRVDSDRQLQDSVASTNKSRRNSIASTTGSSDVVTGGGLHEYFQQQGRDEMVAINTVAAFKAFLKQQHALTSERDSSDHSYLGSWSSNEDKKEKGSSSDSSDDPFSHSQAQYWGSESMLECDDDDIKSFKDDSHTTDEWASFGRVRRNEAFVKRVSSKDLLKSKSEGTLRSSLFDTQSTIKTDRSSLTMSTLETKESPPSKVLFATKSPTNMSALQSTRSLDAITRSERTVERQLASLSLSQRACVNALKLKWERQNGVNHWFPDEYYLRFARCSPGDPFNFANAWKVMERFDWRYYELTMSKMEATVLTKAAFPVPGLKTKGGRDVFYMRPSRYFPRKASTNNMIDLVVYVMNCMLEKEHGSVHGLGLVANMAGWTMENFSVPYWHKLLITLQGHRVPTRISVFLIVDPPSWFDSILTIMHTMMSDDFREKIAVVSSEDLKTYLMDGYHRYLPDDMQGGRMDTNHIVKAFTAERKASESTSRLQKLSEF